MTERGRRTLQRDGEHIAIGPSRALWDGTALTIAFDEIAVPVPKRLKGKVRVIPSAITTQAYAIDGQAQHHWWPIAPVADIEVTLSHPALSWKGHGYCDSNWGSHPLENAFERWDWSRARLCERPGAAILYDAVHRPPPQDTASGTGPVFPRTRTLALHIDEKGHAEPFEPGPRRDLGRGFWGVQRYSQADAGHDVAIRKVLEDSPFYARTVLDTTLLGERVEAVHESLSGDRFKTSIVKAMLPFRMPRRVR